MSACLLGERTRYDGSHKGDESLLSRLQNLRAQLVPVCPEVAGGLAIPRPAAEIERGDGAEVLQGRSRVLTVESNEDVTEAFVSGARMAVDVARQHGAKWAILQERSPSCGVQATHSAGGLVDGSGVAAAALTAAGLSVAAVD